MRFIDLFQLVLKAFRHCRSWLMVGGLSLIFMGLIPQVQADLITTVAGGGSDSDGGAATSAKLYNPTGVVVDSSGNLYIADSQNNRIRKVDTNGIITTIAGDGTQGYSGDGGDATSAQFDNPNGVTIDSSGNLYIADQSNHRIRKVDTNGIITTVAGDGTQGYSGDGGTATSAQLDAPQDVVVDSNGNLYIADSQNNRIRKVDANGLITTIAGDGTQGYSGDGGAATSAQLSSPLDVAVDSSGNLYIADNNRIRKVDANGVITTVAGSGEYGGYSGDGGAATSATLFYPSGVAVDSSGNLYIVDPQNSRIRKVDANNIITTVVGTGKYGYNGDGMAASDARLNSPSDIAVDSSGNLYIADSRNYRIRKVEIGITPQAFSCTTITEIPQTECNALIALYNSTDGVNWNANIGWDIANNSLCTDWYGITCENGRVSSLALNDNQLRGSIPAEIGNLASLQTLSLRSDGSSSNTYNSLTGSIPAEIGKLVSLKTLDLYGNQLSGSIPAEIGKLGSLQTLNLQSNQLNGSIPPEMGNLASLQTLNLSFNLLNGSIPAEIGNLANLLSLDLSANPIGGSIPPEIGNLTSLLWLDLSGDGNSLSSVNTKNLLSGSIPAEIGNLANLQTLDLSYNIFSSIPAEIGNLANLQTLNLSFNSFILIPTEIGNLAGLQSLYLGSNQLSGSIPAEIGNLANLETLDLANNELRGLIPAEIGNLANLQRLDLGNNQLSAPIPLEIGNLASLQFLRLSGTQISGPIPTSILNLTSLWALYLNHTLLTSIPAEIGNLTSLQHLYLYDNQISGSIPAEIGNLTSLQILYLYNNQLSGPIPAEIGNLVNLEELRLSHNQLSGSIPAEIGNLTTNLQYVDLYDNQLTGAIPSELENLSGLSNNDYSRINLSCNLLTIPSSQSLVDFIDKNSSSPSVSRVSIYTTDSPYSNIYTNYSSYSNINWKDSQDGACPPFKILSPAVLNATAASQTQIDLSWIDNSNNEAGFKIERDQALITTTAADATSYSDTGLTCGTTYSYSVKATSANGDSTEVMVSGTTQTCPTSIPNAPTNFSGSATSQTQVDLSWTDNSTGETGFKVERDGTLITTTAADATSYSDSDLSCGTTYSYSVKATNANGDSTAVTGSATTQACSTSAPLSPTALNAAVVSQTQINLSWTDNSSDETGFKIERDGTLITTTAVEATSYSDTGLSCGTTYSYSVKATNGNGDSTAVTESATTPACSTSSGNRVSLSGITLICNDCTINNVALETVAAQPVSPGDYNFPEGLVSFELSDIVKPQAHLDIYFHNINSLDNFIYRKYGPTTPGDPNSANWYNFSDVTIGLDTLDGQTMLKASLTLADGVFGDDTGVDGRIVDAGGIASAIVTTTPSTAVSTTPLCKMSDSDIINTSCNAGEQTFTKEVKVEENSSVARAIFEGDVDNKGMISNSTVGPNATLTGGKLTGTIINEGTITDVEFVGMKLSGGTLSGTITNNSQVGGIIKDVKLAAGTTLKGGKVGGRIIGDPDDPALITAAKILPGTYLSNVRLSPTVELPKNIVFGPGVILPSQPPTLADFGLEPEDIAKLDAETLGNLEPAVFATLTAEDIKTIPPEAFVALKPAQIAEIQKAALEGLTTEQFEQTPIKTLGGLTSENMGGLPIEVINELTPEHLNALDVKEFKAMPSEDVSKLLTNFDAEKITPQNAKKLVPNRWELNLETGALTAPVGAKVSFQSLPPKRYSSSETNSANSGTNNVSSGAFSLPKIPNLKAGFGIGGGGTPLMENTQRSLEEEDMTDFVLSQDENGILLVEGTGESAGVLYTFIPDADNAIQVNTDKIPIGLSTSSGGFYTITTPDGIQYKVIPAPKNPVALSEILGGTEVVIGERGDVLIELPTKTRRGGARIVLIFDPFVEPAPEDICVEVSPGEIFCEFDNAPEHIQRPGLHLPTGNTLSTRAGEQAKVVYPDGTAQTVRPTVLSPDIFIQEGMEIDGVERMLFKANGSFYAFYQGNSVWIRPNFEVKTETVEVDGAIAPSITPNDKSGVTYTIAIDEPTQTRRGGARQILIFDLFIEPAPEDLCVELETGETFCEFDNAAEHVQPFID